MKQTQNLLHNYWLQSTIIAIQEPNISITVIQSSSISIIFLLSFTMCLLVREIIPRNTSPESKENRNKKSNKVFGAVVDWITLPCIRVLYRVQWGLMTETNVKII